MNPFLITSEKRDFQSYEINKNTYFEEHLWTTASVALNHIQATC